MELDRDLVEASLEGRTEAFAALVERYRYAVFGLCLSRLGNADAAEDTAQEAFIKAFLQLRGLKELDRFAPWLKQIAANQCRMWQRNRPHAVPLDEELVGAEDSPEEGLVERQNRRAALAALGRLSPAQQQVVTLFYLEGLSLKQIAAFLGIELQTANQRLYRARLNLKEEMLNMVEETLGQQKLPEDFTAEVIRVALDRGRQLLEKKRWIEAKAEFRKITATIADHVEAQRGLALALDGQVGAMLREGAEPMDEKLIQEALAALEEAYRLGARDWEAVWSLAEIYFLTHRYGDEARVLEEFAGAAGKAEEKFKALRYAAWNYKRIGDDQRGYELIRRALEVEGIELRERLSIYFAGAIPLYQRLGKGEEWLAETRALYEQLEAPLNETDYMYCRDRMMVLERLERWGEAVETGRHYLSRLEGESVDDPPRRRWWVSDTLGLLIRAQRQMGKNATAAEDLQTARDNLHWYGIEWQGALAASDDAAYRETDRTYRRFFTNAQINLACLCSDAGLYGEAVDFLAQGLVMREKGTVYMHLATTHMRAGNPDGALKTLRLLRSSATQGVRRYLFTGDAQKWFEGSEAFATVREDRAFKELVAGGAAQ